MKLFINKIIVLLVLILLFADFNSSMEIKTTDDEINLCTNYDVSEEVDQIQVAKPEWFKNKPEEWLKNPKSKLNKAMRFAKGPCKPVIAVPGIFSTRLSLIIDCQKLKADKDLQMIEDVKYFCGMRSLCQNPTDEVIFDDFWPAVLGNEGMMKSQFSDKDNACMGFFMKFLNNQCTLENKQEKCRYKKYVKLLPEGLQKTNFTQKDSKVKPMHFKCGFAAVNNLLKGSGMPQDIIQRKDKLGFNNLYESLKTMGYIEGFNMGAVPYEFKEAFCTNKEFKETFFNMVKLLFENTGKKVVIVAHSYGNLNVHHQITNGDKTLSDMIDHFVAIAPPFAGSPKADIMIAKGTEEFKMKSDEVTINYHRFAQSLSFPYMPMMSSLRSSNYFESIKRGLSTRFKEGEWIKHLEKEVKLSTCTMQKLNKNAESKLKNLTSCKDSLIDYDDKSNLLKNYYEEEFKWKIDKKNICGSKDEVNARIAKLPEYKKSKLRPILDPCEIRMYDIKNCPLIKTAEVNSTQLGLIQHELVGLMCPNHKKEVKAEPTGDDVHCADEGSVCQCSGTVMFGTFGENPKYHEQGVDKEINCDNNTFGDPTPGIVKTCRCDSKRVWRHCAKENEKCQCKGTVWYGVGGKIHGRDSETEIDCNNATFGDPIPGTVKTCRCDDLSERHHCADENKTCKCKGEVFFGANGYIHQRDSRETVTGSIACTNTIFEDPIPGVLKTCKCKLDPVDAPKKKKEKEGYYVMNKVKSPIDPNSVDAYLDEKYSKPQNFTRVLKRLAKIAEQNKYKVSKSLTTDYTGQRIKEVIEYNHKTCNNGSIEKNPKVKTTIIFNKSIETNGAFLVNDQKNTIQPKKNTVWVGGDGTVPVDSSMIAGLRWLNSKKQDPDNKKLPEIRFLDYCSPIKSDDIFSKDFIYIPINDRPRDPNTKVKDITPIQEMKKYYQFLNCECKPKENGNTFFNTDIKPCSHTQMLDDEHIKHTIIDTLNVYSQPASVVIQEYTKTTENILKNKRNYESCRKIFADAYLNPDNVDIKGFPYEYSKDAVKRRLRK